MHAIVDGWVGTLERVSIISDDCQLQGVVETRIRLSFPHTAPPSYKGNRG